MVANVGRISEELGADADVQTCYKSFLERRQARGELSIRTPEGFERLQKKYQLFTRSDTQTTNEDDTRTPIGSEVNSPSVVALFFNTKILRIITETCWPLALFGGGIPHTEKECVGFELPLDKYSTFTFRLIQWAFPELPRRAAQELAEYDWEVDRRFDEFGGEGLSLQGFENSLIDLIITCTDGSVGKCLEFLNLMTRWLQHSLPPYPIQDIISPVAKDSVNVTKTLCSKPDLAISWNTIPLLTMTPCVIDSQGLYCELKVKVSAAPMAIMVMATDENPIEFILSTKSKLLISKCETCGNVHRKVAQSNILHGDVKGKDYWTFNLNPNTPSIVLIPNANISRRTKALYGCFRTVELDNHDMDHNTHMEEFESTDVASPATEFDTALANSAASSLVTLLTSIPEQNSVHFGDKNSVCYRMERMSTRVFTTDPTTKPFSITVTAALLQNTHSAGGPGAAAALSSTFTAESTFTVSESHGIQSQKTNEKLDDAHTFVIIMKTSVPIKLKGSELKHHDVSLPQQWFTSLNSANEIKTIIFESHLKQNAPVISKDTKSIGKQPEDCADESRMEIFNIFIFTLHGIYIEVTCAINTSEPDQSTETEYSDTKTQEKEKNHNNFSETPVTSCILLKKLLLLQKTRQLEKRSERLPDIVIGTQICTAKPVTTAELLRTKVLCSRQDKRKTRLEQLDAAIRRKLFETKSRPQTRTKPNITAKTEEKVVSSKSELVDRATRLSTFFHEMAVHRPKVGELHGIAVELAEAEAEAAAEKQLLQQFGDLFDRDEDLQNALDEEKWSTEAAKTVRRRESLVTNLPKTLASDAVSKTYDHMEESNWTFEDYEHTAQYIEQLMVDVSTHTTQEKQVESLATAERKREVMTQLVASWQYTKHRVDRPETRERVCEIKQKRRSKWMKSQYIQAQRFNRPAIVLPEHQFLTQKQFLPSNAVWKVSESPNILLTSDSLAADNFVNPGTKSPQKMNIRENSSKFHPQRPMTGSAGRSSNITALRSAALSRARVRRIRSAHSSICSPLRLQVTDSRQEEEVSLLQEQKSIHEVLFSTSEILSESDCHEKPQNSAKPLSPSNAVDDLKGTSDLL